MVFEKTRIYGAKTSFFFRNPCSINSCDQFVWLLSTQHAGYFDIGFVVQGYNARAPGFDRGWVVQLYLPLLSRSATFRVPHRGADIPMDLATPLFVNRF